MSEADPPTGRELVALVRSRIGQDFDHECHLTDAEAHAIVEALTASEARVAELLEVVKAVHEPYKTLTDEALQAGILMEYGPPKPDRGAALLLARSAIARASSSGLLGEKTT